MKIIFALIVTILIGSQTPVQAQINNIEPTPAPIETVGQPVLTEIPTTPVEPITESVVQQVEVQVQETPVIRPEKTELLRAVNIPEDQWYAVDYILSKESTDWCPTRWQGQHGNCPSAYSLLYEGAEQNKSLGYGICQSTPAIKMESAGSDWRTNAITQLRWCNDYAIARYGSWHGAYNARLRQRWW